MLSLSPTGDSVSSTESHYRKNIFVSKNIIFYCCMSTFSRRRPVDVERRGRNEAPEFVFYPHKLLYKRCDGRRRFMYDAYIKIKKKNYDFNFS